MDRSKDWIFDIETFKHAFTLTIVRADTDKCITIECSHRKNEIARLVNMIDYIKKTGGRLVGFNNVGFDYPVIHELLDRTRYSNFPKTGDGVAALAHRIANQQIEAMNKSMGFGATIKTEDCLVPQVDLYRIHHFNNKAKATSLKMLEFNMRMDNIEDLPFAIDAKLSSDDIDKLIEYNIHDVRATKRFYEASASQIQFRDDLSVKLNKNLTNADDTKIGAEYFQLELENAGVKTRVFKDGKMVMKQTKRDKIKINDCLFNYYQFTIPAFKAVHEWFKRQVITETKGVFSDIEEHNLGDVAKYAELDTKRIKMKKKDEELPLLQKQYPLGWVEEKELKATEYLFDSEGNHVMAYPLDADGSPDLTKKQKKVRVPKKSYYFCRKIASNLNVVIDGLRIDFGVGGIHASLSEKAVKETKKYKIRDADVSSMYPNIAISNKVFPAHLSEVFCEVYESLYIQRKSYGKKTAENAMLKLALNGTYGKSNDKYSVFYDPQYTMTITINGQLSLLMLVDMLLKIDGMKIIQLNTDGVTVAMLRDTEDQYNKVCEEWQKIVKLELEFVDYKKMLIRDVNNYIAIKMDDSVKRKGAYQWVREELGWHQNQSSLVIPMVAEQVMLSEDINDVDSLIMELLKKHYDASPDNKFDFMLRTKVDRKSRLVLRFEDGSEKELQRICRYYPCKQGGKLIKIMPPLECKQTDGEEPEDRNLSIDAAWNVKPCNNMVDFAGDIDYNYYVSEVKKLLILN